jgi:P27 family predicted phage terminase small subunit
MGRRRDDPRDQAAKGMPGRRPAKTKREIAAIEAMEKNVDRDAATLADAASKGFDLADLPAFLKDRRLAEAQKIWREYAPQLRRQELLSNLDRHTFAMFCIYAAEFAQAQADLLKHGYSQKVLTVVGAKVSKSKRDASCYMLRDNPALARRDHAHDAVMRLAGTFGLTPLDRYKLMSHGKRLDDQGLFGRPRTPAATGDEPPGPPQPPPPPEPESDLIGALANFDNEGPPPDGKLQ